MEESAAGQPVELRKGDPGLNNSFSIRQFNAYIVGSPRDGHILSRINCFLSRACNLSTHCGHDWCLRLCDRKKFRFTAGILLVLLSTLSFSLRHREEEDGEKKRRRRNRKPLMFSQQKEDRGKKISKLWE